MKDQTRMEHIEKWARFVRDNPRSVWKAELKQLIDSQIVMANRFYSMLGRMPGGKEKIRKLRELYRIH
jgi:hypothetical protein